MNSTTNAEALERARLDFEGVGGALKFFLGCCRYLSQHPEDVHGLPSEYENEDAWLEATLLGATMHFVAQAWHGLEWRKSRFQVQRGDGQVSLEVAFPTGREFQGAGFELLHRMAASFELAQRDGEAAVRLVFTGVKLAVERARARPEGEGCPPFIVQPAPRDENPK